MTRGIAAVRGCRSAARRSSACGATSAGRRALRAFVATFVAVALLAIAGPRSARADLKTLEAEFKDAIERVETATVVVVPRDVPGGGAGLSGVIISKTGLVLTHAHAGRIDEAARGKPAMTRYVDEVDVRVPNLKKGTFTNYRARVVRRFPELQVAIARFEEPPKAGFSSFLAPATAADLRVGSFTFAMGNAFGMADEMPPSLTAGVVAAIVRRAGTTDIAGAETIYTTAAINPGVSGGPLVDVKGRLVGIVMGWVDAAAEPMAPFQFLGRVCPIDRVRAAVASIPEARDAFEKSPPKALLTPESDALEMVLGRTAVNARPGIASLEVRRKVPVSSTTLGPAGKPVDLPRYRGPVSAFVVSEDGLLATALYNVTNLATLVNPQFAGLLAPEATTRAGIDAIEGATATFPDGLSVPAKLVAVHEPLGVALFRAELPEGRRVRPLEAAPPDAFAEGRFVLVVADPYGATQPPEPFLSFGILSKLHADDAPDAWRGHWQTDARATDGNCGAAVVDLRGRLLGMLTLWNPVRHQRASGIAFVLPWKLLAAALPEMSQGRSFRRPLLGIQWDTSAVAGARILKVSAGSAAAVAGLKDGDEIVEFEGRPIASRDDFVAVASGLWAGDVVRLKIRRGPDVIELRATLGARD